MKRHDILYKIINNQYSIISSHMKTSKEHHTIASDHMIFWSISTALFTSIAIAIRDHHDPLKAKTSAKESDMISGWIMKTKNRCNSKRIYLEKDNWSILDCDIMMMKYHFSANECSVILSTHHSIISGLGTPHLIQLSSLLVVVALQLPSWPQAPQERWIP